MQCVTQHRAQCSDFKPSLLEPVASKVSIPASVRREEPSHCEQPSSTSGTHGLEQSKARGSNVTLRSRATASASLRNCPTTQSCAKQFPSSAVEPATSELIRCKKQVATEGGVVKRRSRRPVKQNEVDETVVDVDGLHNVVHIQQAKLRHEALESNKVCSMHRFSWNPFM